MARTVGLDSPASVPLRGRRVVKQHIEIGLDLRRAQNDGPISQYRESRQHGVHDFEAILAMGWDLGP